MITLGSVLELFYWEPIYSGGKGYGVIRVLELASKSGAKIWEYGYYRAAVDP